MGNLLQHQAPMKPLGMSPKSAAILGLILAMPLAILVLIEVYSIEPLSGFFRALTTEADGHQLNSFGAALTIGALLLLPAAFLINFIPIARNLRAGNQLTANPVNLLFAAVLFIFIATLVVTLIIDQYPCWMGVANCD